MGNSCKPRDTLRQATGTIRASTRRTNLWSGSPGTTRWRTASGQGLPSKVAIEGLPSKVAIEGLPSKVAIEGLPSKVAIEGLPSKVAIEGQEPHGQDGQEQKGFTWENIAAILGTTMMNLNELDKQTLKGWIDRGITPLFVLDLLDSLSALPRKLYKMDKQVKTAWAKRDKTHENTPIPDINHNTRNNLGIGESENKKRSGMMDGLPGSSLEPTSCGYKPVEKNPRPPIIDPVMSRKERHEMYRQKLMEMEETP